MSEARALRDASCIVLKPFSNFCSAVLKCPISDRFYFLSSTCIYKFDFELSCCWSRKSEFILFNGFWENRSNPLFSFLKINFWWLSDSTKSSGCSDWAIDWSNKLSWQSPFYWCLYSPAILGFDIKYFCGIFFFSFSFMIRV